MSDRCDWASLPHGADGTVLDVGSEIPCHECGKVMRDFDVVFSRRIPGRTDVHFLRIICPACANAYLRALQREARGHAERCGCTS